MILIIDGYNLLHAGNIFQKKLTKETLINMTIRYKSIKKHIVFLVFDGGGSFYSQEIQKNGITILFSGYGQTADDAIINLVKMKKNAPEKVLISTDRALAEKAHNYNIISIDSEIFYSILEQSICTKNPIDKQFKKTHENIIRFTSDSNAEIDQLMQEGMIPKKDVREPVFSSLKSQHKTMSHEEKKIAEILKKL